MYYWIGLGLFGVILVAFGAVVHVASLSWDKLSSGKRIAGCLFLLPHFLLIVCIAVGALIGKAPQGSQGFNVQFVCGVLMLFILPLPALVGTLVALAMFRSARA